MKTRVRIPKPPGDKDVLGPGMSSQTCVETVRADSSCVICIFFPFVFDSMLSGRFVLSRRFAYTRIFLFLAPSRAGTYAQARPGVGTRTRPVCSASTSRRWKSTSRRCSTREKESSWPLRYVPSRVLATALLLLLWSSSPSWLELSLLHRCCCSLVTHQWWRVVLSPPTPHCCQSHRRFMPDLCLPLYPPVRFPLGGSGVRQRRDVVSPGGRPRGARGALLQWICLRVRRDLSRAVSRCVVCGVVFFFPAGRRTH